MRKQFKFSSIAAGAFAMAAVTAPVQAQERNIADYVPVLESVIEAAVLIDQETGVGVKEVGTGVFVITDGSWQSAFVVGDEGVVVLDAPESYAPKILTAIKTVTDLPITTLVYSHTHKDHIGGSAAFSGIDGLEIISLETTAHFLAEKQDPNRLVPTETFTDRKTLDLGSNTIELIHQRNYHSDEGDIFIYIPQAKSMMAIDTLAPGYVPFSGFDLSSNFHEYRKVFDDILAYDFDVFVGGHLGNLGTRDDVLLNAAYTKDVYETVKRIHGSTDILANMQSTAEQAGGYDNKYLLFKAFLDKVAVDATKEIEARWIDKLAGVDVFTETHVRTALIYVRWDD